MLLENRGIASMQDEYKKICLILPGKLPVPNIKGGAIETLLTLLINQNEIERKVKFIVICAWCEGIEEISKKYKYTEFHYFKVRIGLWKKIINFINYVIARLTGNIDFFKTPMHYDIEKIIKEIDADVVVVEHGVYKHFRFLKKYFKREQLYLHLHGAGPQLTKDEAQVFGNIITVSRFLNNYYDKDNIRNCKKLVCLNGINEINFKKCITDEECVTLRKQLGFSQSDFVVLYCGRLIPEKGVLELLKAVLSIKKISVKLLVIGASNFQGSVKTPYVLNLEKLIRNNNDRVVFTGYIPNEKLYKYYKISNVQVICSKCQEAAGLVAVEGSISGLHLIVTDSGGLLEYCNSENISIIEKNIYENYDNESEYLIKNIKRHLENYISLGTSQKTNENIYDETKFYSKNFYNRFISILFLQ